MPVPTLKSQWNQFANNLAGTGDYLTLTSSHYGLTRALLPVIRQYAAGKILDLGAGFSTYRSILLEYGDTYVGMDIERHSSRLDSIADGRKLPFANEVFDTVFSSQVLEHTPEPWDLLRDACRVLRPGGVLILSAPHLSYIHAVPEDYYRYTNYGLIFLLRQAGFGEIEVLPAGAVFSLLGSIPQSISLGLLASLSPQLAKAYLPVNRLLSRAIVALDDILGLKHFLAQNYIAIARK